MRAVDVVIAGRNVVKHATGSDSGGLIDGVAGLVARCTEFLPGNGIISWIRIARPDLPLLVHQSLNGRHQPRSTRCPTNASPAAGCSLASLAAALGVRGTDGESVSPDSAGGE